MFMDDNMMDPVDAEASMDDEALLDEEVLDDPVETGEEEEKDTW